MKIGISIGFVFGLAKAIFLIYSNKYFYYRMHRLILFNLTDNINMGILYGLIMVITFTILIKGAYFIRKKLFSAFFEVKVIKKKNLTPLLKVSSFVILFAYLLIQILKYARNTNQGVQFLLGQSLIVSILFLLVLQLEKIDFQLLKSKIFNISKSAGIKISAGVFFSIFVLINILNFGQKLFYSPSGPNVILIVSDALRPDHLGCYGYSRPTSPQIDKFAADALIFEKAMSNSPWTMPSIGTIFTSLYPHEHGAFFWTDNLDNSCLTLAEVFRNKKYATFAIQTNPGITAEYNFNQGFQFYHDLILENGEKVAAKFNDWLEENKNKPFFAYFHFMDTHLQYDAPDEFKAVFESEDTRSPITGLLGAYLVRVLSETGLSSEDKQHLINLYDAEIRYFDYVFGTIIKNLKKSGIFEKTIVILTADHGEELWDHNGFEHGHSLYNEVLHVPLIIKYSSLLPAKRIKSYVQLADLFPTILSMTRIRDDFNLRGKNLTPNILNNNPINHTLFFEDILYGAEKKAVLKDGWKLIENTGMKFKKSLDPLGDLMKRRHPEHKKGFELYNINKDFQEKNNLINEFTQIRNNLRRHLRSFNTRSSAYQKFKRSNLKKKLDDLKSLGYIK
jgi:choline-sulfatase